MEGYSIFLMLELARLHGVISNDLEYDLMWDEAKKLFTAFEASKFDNSDKSLYDCITEFLSEKKEKFDVYVVFGSVGVKLYSEKFEENEELNGAATEELKNAVTYRKFNTEKELNAYLEGVNDANGWFESVVISEENAKEIEKM